MKHFEGLTKEEEIKARYKELAKKFHPDLGGDTETMKEINSQYDTVLRGFYQAAGKSLSEIDEILEKDVVLRSKIDAIITRGISKIIFTFNQPYFTIKFL